MQVHPCGVVHSPSVHRPSLRDESGATAIEYGLLVALIAAVVITTVAVLGDTLQGLYDSVHW
jgi:pilus assembly protein Flp/PilA